MRDRFTLYPAIDLKGGRCVRLLHGMASHETVYHDSPPAQASLFSKAGFGWIHLVDLDGAFAGRPENMAALRAVLENTDLKVQLGGGIRTLKTVEERLAEGFDRVILGTAAVRDPDLVRQACRKFPGRIVIGIDARNGRVKTGGWNTDTGYAPEEIAGRYEDMGVAAVIYTDIGRDGALTGVNVDATAALAGRLSVPVIASGGVAGIRDIRALYSAHPNISGAILGRALYEGLIDIGEAFAVARGGRPDRSDSSSGKDADRT